MLLNLMQTYNFPEKLYKHHKKLQQFAKMRSILIYWITGKGILGSIVWLDRPIMMVFW